MNKWAAPLTDSNADPTARALLAAIAADPALTQRRASQTLGISLGQVNTHLKRLNTDGLISPQAGGARARAYALTAKGQNRLAALVRADARLMMADAAALCQALLALLVAARGDGWTRIALLGLSDLCALTRLAAFEADVTLVGIIDADAEPGQHLRLPVAATAHGMGAVHAVVVTDMETPEATFKRAVQHFPRTRVLVPAVLGLRHETEMP